LGHAKREELLNKCTGLHEKKCTGSKDVETKHQGTRTKQEKKLG
jgi:hypothetical protein